MLKYSISFHSEWMMDKQLILAMQEKKNKLTKMTSEWYTLHYYTPVLVGRMSNKCLSTHHRLSEWLLLTPNEQLLNYIIVRRYIQWNDDGIHFILDQPINEMMMASTLF